MVKADIPDAYPIILKSMDELINKWGVLSWLIPKHPVCNFMFT